MRSSMHNERRRHIGTTGIDLGAARVRGVLVVAVPAHRPQVPQQEKQPETLEHASAHACSVIPEPSDESEQLQSVLEALRVQ